MTDKISPDEVRARWAYSELLSGGFNSVDGMESVLQKFWERVPFGKLSQTEQNQLAHAWQEVRGVLRPAFDGIEAFQLTQWSQSDLAQVLVIPHFVLDIASPSLAQSLLIPFGIWINAEPIRPLHQALARFAMYDLRPIGEVEPLTVGLRDQKATLLDGYHRAVRYWHRYSAEPTVTLPVFVPSNT